jgi:RND family efflux transporter MFP subunit
MRAWTQIVLSVVLLMVAIFAFGRLAPGAAAMLSKLGLPHSMIAVIAPAGADVADASQPPAGGKAPAGRRGSGGSPLVTAQTVGEGVANDRLTALGNGAALHSVSITPRVAGKLSTISVKAGDHVAAGQVIARLNDDQQKIALDQAKFAYDTVREKLTRYETLKTTIYSKLELAEVRAAAEAARLALETAKLDMSNCDIVSPVSGIAGIVTAEVGDNLTTSTEIVRVDDRSGILVDFWVPEQYARAISIGTPVSATSIARPGETFEGAVEAIDNRVDEASRTLHVRASIPNARDELRAGMSFTVAMKFDGDHYPAVAPLSIQWDSNGSYVWRIKDGKVSRTAVKIIQRNPENVLVEADLKPGDQIVSEGVQRVRQGIAVTVADAQAGAPS